MKEKKQKSLIVLLICFTCNVVFAAENTEIEKFSSETGKVFIKGYTEVKTISALGGSISFETRITGTPDVPEARKGIAIKVTRGNRTGASMIDEKEIDDLLAGIRYISRATKAVTSLENFEVSYATPGGFSITVFNSSGGGLSVSVVAGSSSVFPKFSDLPEIILAIESARP